MKPIYLDYAAATPMDKAAISAMQPYLADNFYNPSAVYQSAREVRQDVEAARGKVADALGAKDQEIIFTAGGTEANNLAIHGVMAQFPGGHVITSAIEHESVLEPVKHYDHSIVPVSPDGLLDVASLKKQITDRTVLISVMYANNEIGTIQPLKEVAQIVRAVRSERARIGNDHPLLIHTDAAQAGNYLDLHVNRLGVDLMTLNGGKIYAAKQSGCLYMHRGTNLVAVAQGGGQEQGIRNGTENVAAIQAFATMLQIVQSKRKVETARLNKMRENIIATLSQNKINFIINGSMKKRLPNNLNITIPGADGERLLMELDTAGLMVATGSACTASNDEPSHVLLALGLSPADASASLRLSLGAPTTEQEVKRTGHILFSAIEGHRLV